MEFDTFLQHKFRSYCLYVFLFLYTRWSVARAFPPVPSKTKSSRPHTEVECVDCNETWQASRLINYLFIGVISSHVTAIVTGIVMSYMMSKFGIRKKIQERKSKI